MSGAELRQRLAAILAADAVAYSRLMGIDERATVAALDAARAVFRQQIESNRGRVIDMAGDSVLAVFDSATAAANAALAIQTRLDADSSNHAADRCLRYRIGIHLGDVMEKADGTVYGDGVNIAARLESLADPGGIAVSDSLRNAVQRKVAAGFEDLGEQTVKNIAESVRAFRMMPEDSAKSTPVIREVDLPLPNKPSIAVLPFNNMSGDPGQEYFADGVTEDIITELARFHSLFVIARNSSFSYKGRSPDVRQVGKELGVRYLLEGSVRKSSDRIRVTAQLIDALSGSHLWAEKYDRSLEDIFTVQEEVTQSIVAAIAPEVLRAEQRQAQRHRPENFGAHELALLAAADVREADQKSEPTLKEKALAEAQRALALDPNNYLAHSVIASQRFLQLFLHVSGAAAATDARWREGVASATRLIELDPSASTGFARMAALLSIAGRSAEALSNARRACELNPNDVEALSFLAYVELMEGEALAALEHAIRVTRLNPRDPSGHRVLSLCAAACFLLRDHARGLDFALRAVAAAPNDSITHANHLLVAVGLGEIDVAKTAFKTIERLDPEFAKVRLAGNSPYHRPQDAQRVTLAWRIAAGLVEPSAADSLR